VLAAHVERQVRLSGGGRRDSGARRTSWRSMRAPCSRRCSAAKGGGESWLATDQDRPQESNHPTTPMITSRVNTRTYPSGATISYGYQGTKLARAGVVDGRRLPGASRDLRRCLLGYATQLYEPPAGFKADWRILLMMNRPPDQPRAGIIQWVEGNRWIVTIAGVMEDYPPTDERGFVDFARTLRSPALYEAIQHGGCRRAGRERPPAEPHLPGAQRPRRNRRTALPRPKGERSCGRAGLPYQRHVTSAALPRLAGGCRRLAVRAAGCGGDGGGGGSRRRGAGVGFGAGRRLVGGRRWGR
jgi:hypothetical protein